ncbi:MAG: NAD(+) synthase [Gemmatimonadota bacterium]
MSHPALPAIALAQMEVRPGRPDLNLATMVRLIDRARSEGAEVVAFPELCLSGYIIGDLWEVDALVADFAAYSEEVRSLSRGLVVVFGNVAVDPEAIGEDGRIRKYNAVFVCRDGQFVSRQGLPLDLPHGSHPKTLHPNYRFFDDDRHFFSLRKLAQACGRPVYDWIVPYAVELAGGRTFRFGVQVCEDIWCQDYCYEGQILDTLGAYQRRGAEAVLNLSSSPWTWQKNDKRNRTVRQILARSPVPFFYVNQVGAQNNGKNVIVFDGDTTAYLASGQVSRRAAPWREELVVVRGPGAVAPRQGETEALYQAVLTGLRHLDHVRGGQNRFLVGASGGIDSSLVTCLLARAFGPERVFAVNMPTRYNAPVTQENARRLCARLGIDYLSCPIEDLYQQVSLLVRGAGFARSSGHYTQLVDENIQARIRSSDVLAGLAAKHGLMFTNNGNKTELALGYCTLYGDVNGAIAPIADLYKVQVFELAAYLNEQVFGEEVIPANLLSRQTVPSAELSADQDVTRGLGDPIKYGYHDAVLRQLIEYRRHVIDLMAWFAAGELLARLGFADAAAFRAYFADGAAWLADLEWVDRQVRTSFFKRVQAPPLIVLSKRAFGFDLRETQWPEYRPRAYEGLRRQVLDSPVR